MSHYLAFVGFVAINLIGCASIFINGLICVLVVDARRDETSLPSLVRSGVFMNALLRALGSGLVLSCIWKFRRDLGMP